MIKWGCIEAISKEHLIMMISWPHSPRGVIVTTSVGRVMWCKLEYHSGAAEIDAKANAGVLQLNVQSEKLLKECGQY